jgi:hypothetical protein
MQNVNQPDTHAIINAGEPDNPRRAGPQPGFDRMVSASWSGRRLSSPTKPVTDAKL